MTAGKVSPIRRQLSPVKTPRLDLDAVFDFTTVFCSFFVSFHCQK